MAIELASNSDAPFARNPLPWWYERDHLALNMLSAIGPTYTLARFVLQLDRCTNRTIGQAITERFGKGRLCRDINRAEAAELLGLLRQHVPAKIKPKQLGPMKEAAWKHERLTDGYACEEGTFNSGHHEPCAQIPFLVEAWAKTSEPQAGADEEYAYPVKIIGFTINRSPAIVQSSSGRKGKSRTVWLTLGDLFSHLSVTKGAFEFAVNITSSYVPILSDNKSPSLDCFKEAIVKAVEKALQRSARNNPPTLLVFDEEEPDDEEEEQKSERIVLRKVIWEVIPEAIRHSCFNDEGVPFSSSTSATCPIASADWY